MKGNDLTYLLYWDDDAIPINSNITLGNHLENDVVVPGEDVADYHVRIEVSERGPVLIPLGNATVNINGRECESPIQVIIGDVITIGQATMQVGVEIETAPELPVQQWELVAHATTPATAQKYTLSGEVSVGRSERAEISLPDEHISRHHARLVERHNVVWLQDLQSANGTRVNGLPIVGGVRLFHGDTVAFDKLEFQLIGIGGDLTPVEQFGEPLRGTERQVPRQSAEPAPQLDTTEFLPVEEDAAAAQPTREVEVHEAGAFLLGTSDPVDGAIFRMSVGESMIGRSPQSDILVNDPTVSQSHAKLSVQPEGITLTNLMSTNGTRVNGSEIASVRLEDGDVIRLGRVSLVFKEIPPESIEQHPLFRRIRFWVLGATALVAVLFLLTII